MFKKVSIVAGLAMILLASAAHADVAEVKKAVLERFPKLTAESIGVTKTGYPGLYEIYADGQLFYTDEAVSYFVVGDLIDAKSMKNLTDERMHTLTAISFDTLPLDLAIKTVKGNGKRKLAVFSDPDCPFCRRLEKEMVNVTDVTVYTFLYPIVSLHPNAAERAKAVWCSADRNKAWYDYMLKGIVPDNKDCPTPIDTIAQLGQKHRINGTPTMIFVDGRVVPGAISAPEVEKYLGKADDKK